MKFINPLFAYFLIIVVASCGNKNENSEWLIPQDQVQSGGSDKDGIPALLNPEMISAEEASYLDDDDLVIGFEDRGRAKAYSHKILDHHEIINDRIGSKDIAITYCPLTGTGIGWDRNFNGSATTFGVSGLLYNSNLIPYDRATNSHWTQIGLTCVNGKRIGERMNTYPVIETTWGSWRQMYPETQVISTNTGHIRDYEDYPYGNYREEDALLFSVAILDERLPKKERVHALVDDELVKVYRLDHFLPNPVITDLVNEREIVLVGSPAQKFITSFENIQVNGEWLNFFPQGGYTTENGFVFPTVMVDQFGNGYNVFGEVVAGPNQGDQLEPTTSFMAYWFSLTSFYPIPDVYQLP